MAAAFSFGGDVWSYFFDCYLEFTDLWVFMVLGVDGFEVEFIIIVVAIMVGVVVMK